MPRKKDTTLATPDIAHFEKSLTELTQLVERMEKGHLPLAESLQHFEAGVKLIRDCQAALTQAEQRVHILTQQHGLEPFTHDD